MNPLIEAQSVGAGSFYVMGALAMIVLILLCVVVAQGINNDALRTQLDALRRLQRVMSGGSTVGGEDLE
jgi:hypothetical protein